jgi:methionyl-tRNA formyltransferase
MLVRKATPIDPDEDSSSLHDRLAIIGADALAETLDLLSSGQLVSRKQDDALSCYAPMLKKEDGMVDWGQPAQTVKNLVRGMTPWPGAFTFLDTITLKICRAGVAHGSGAPGTVLQAGKKGLEVACADGSIIIEELQLEGRKRLKAADFLAGCKIEAGTILGKKDGSRD